MARLIMLLVMAMSGLTGITTIPAALRMGVWPLDASASWAAGWVALAGSAGHGYVFVRGYWR